MDNFIEVQTAIMAGRNKLHEAKEEQYKQTEAKRMAEMGLAEKLLAQGIEVLPPNDPLNLQLTNSQARLIEIEETIQETKGQLSGLYAQFKEHPIEEQLSVFDAQTPFLLLPLKVQSRFIKLKHVVRNIAPSLLCDVEDDEVEDEYEAKPWSPDNLQFPNIKHREFLNNIIRSEGSVLFRQDDTYELWIRIFPDDIFVHSHEENLTVAEYKAAKRYWQRIFEIDRDFIEAIEAETEEEEGRDQQKKTKLAAWTWLHQQYGMTRAAWIAKAIMPTNRTWEDGIELREAPLFPEVSLKSSSWTRPPRTYTMPDRFAVRLYQDGSYEEHWGELVDQPLFLGLGPNHAQYIQEANGQIEMPEDAKWLSDFDAAVHAGMALRIPIVGGINTAARGYDKIVVLGIRSTSDADESQKLVEDLLTNHQYTPRGTSLLPIGTPTNNIANKSTYSDHSKANAATGFELEMQNPLFEHDPRHLFKRDGQRLVEALGIDPKQFQHVIAVDGLEASNALAMNQLLWMGTMGYYLNTFFTPIIEREALDKLYRFFIHYVSGRGLLPTLRIGRQPYGILPTTAYSRWKYRNKSFSQGLHKVLQLLEKSWDRLLAEEVKNIGNYGEEETFSDFFIELMRMAPNSTLYKAHEIYRHNKATGSNRDWARLFQDPTQINFDPNRHAPLGQLLNLIEGNPADLHLFHKYYLSEIFQYGYAPQKYLLFNPINPDKAADINYLEWLSNSPYPQIKGAQSDHQEAFPFLHGLARYSMLNTYIDAAYKLLRRENKASPYANLEFELSAFRNLTYDPLEYETNLDYHDEYLRRLKRDYSRARALAIDVGRPNDMNLINNEVRKGNRRRLQETRETVNREGEPWIHRLHKEDYLEIGLFRRDEKIHELIDSTLLNQRKGAPYMLSNAKSASKRIGRLPLEAQKQLFAEHLDLCSYRLDAWKQGLVLERLDQQRSTEGNENGIYLGAYGYLEDLRYQAESSTGIVLKYVEAQTWVPAHGEFPKRGYSIIPAVNLSAYLEMPQEVKEQSFVYLGKRSGADEVAWDPERNMAVVIPQIDQEHNDGFIHAPSLGHASTAAILRSGYTAQKQDDAATSTPLAVQLDSKRVRKAIQYLEGIQNGQTLPALLGYQLERALHDDDLDAIIFDIRKQYPLELEDESDQAEEQAERIRPMNVIDGLSLIEDHRAGDHSKLEAAIAGQEDKLDALLKHVQALDETLDGTSDLLLAESVYQWSQGKPARARAALRILDDGGNIQLPEIIQSPINGLIISHKVGVLLDPNLTNKSSHWSSLSGPAASMSPHLNAWLEKQLPDPREVLISIKIEGVSQKYALASFPLQPIDLMHFIRNGIFEPESEFALWIGQQIQIKQGTYRQNIQVDFLSREGFQDQHICFYELMPLLNRLSYILNHSRPLKQTDFLPGKMNFQNQDVPDEAWANRIQIVMGNGPDSLQGHIQKLQEGIAALNSSSDTNKKVQAHLHRLILESAKWRIPQAIAPVVENENQVASETLLAIAQQILKELENRFETVKSMWGNWTSDQQKYASNLEAITKCLFGERLIVFPAFPQAEQTSWSYAFGHKDSILPKDQPLIVEEWLQGLSVVRPHLQNYQRLSGLRNAYRTDDAEQSLQIVQLPMVPGEQNEWMGIAFSTPWERGSNPLGLALEIPEAYDPESLHMGFVIDEWTEKIPQKESTTGISFNYNQPNAEAPQAILLAVSPKESGNWEWEELMATILDTFDLAKKRTMDPDILMKDPLIQRLLPAASPIISKSDLNMVLGGFGLAGGGGEIIDTSQ